VIFRHYRFLTHGQPVGDFDGQLTVGHSHIVQGPVDDAMPVIEPGKVVDAFTPPHEDYP
jgi:hypothetical protein